ncbi:MAG: hypothetical protein JWQ33_1606 [Ramlibacter sp.]|nr:hypothetical protein [Ramlibacter sp.]
MQTSQLSTDRQRYAKTIEVSRRVRWDIDRDVIRGREFDLSHKFLPDGLSLVDQLPFLDPQQQRFMSQVQGRTYANMFGLVERFIGAKMLEVSRDHWLGDQTALEAIVRFTDEELKHQELFRRIEVLVAASMPPGYSFDVSPNDVATFVLGKSTWAVLALTCHIELFSQAHYRASIDGDAGLSALFKDVFLYHWKEESQHAIIDELEWAREDARLASDAERDAGVDDLIALVGGVDGILQSQARADAAYFLAVSGIAAEDPRAGQVNAAVLKAYRWQYIVSGAMEPRFQAVLAGLVSDTQMQRIQAALAPLAYAVPSAAQRSRALAH